MALILLGGGVTDARGSIGGMTFSRNAAGNYVRARMKPVNPNSENQQLVRSWLSQSSICWRDTLTQAERDAWTSYATSTTWLNSLGQTIKLSGQQMFCRSNCFRLRLGLGIIAIAPTTPGIPPQPSLWTPSADYGDNQISIAFTFPVDIAGSHYGFFASPPLSPGRTFCNGPWRYIGKISGNSGTPPTSPQTFDYPWTLGPDQLIFVRCRFLDPDVRLSETVDKSCTPTDS